MSKERREERRVVREERKRSIEILTHTYYYTIAKCRNCGKEFESGRVKGWDEEVVYGGGCSFEKLNKKSVIRGLKGLTFHEECNGIADIIRLEERVDTDE
jgi:hypothetical protein